MSSFNAKLNFADNPIKGFEILQCNYSFHQKTDEKGRPSWPSPGENIFIQLTIPPDDFLLKWMADSLWLRSDLIFRNFFR